MEIKQPLDYGKHEKIIQAIRRCANTPRIVRFSETKARVFMDELGIREKGVLQAIIEWIDEKKDIYQDVSTHKNFPGELMYVFKNMEIDGTKLYVKVKLVGDILSVCAMDVISVHP